MNPTPPVIALVVAMAENRAIGLGGNLPWHLSSDMRYFRKITMGKPIVMGRLTFKSLGRALPGRVNIVLTRDRGLRRSGRDHGVQISRRGSTPRATPPKDGGR